MNRRQWLSGIAASIAAAKFLPIAHAAEPKPVMPNDFVGLSYESTQLYNPAFFSAANTALVAAFRDLNPTGVLRLGGNLSDYSRWHSDAGDFLDARAEAAIEHGKTYWEWKLTDQRVRDNRAGAITPAALRALREFLDATGWKAIYGLNFGSGSIARAQDEAAHVSRILGDRLLALQFGNEVDFYGGNAFFRGKDYAFPAYLAEFKTFAAAVRQAAPGAPIAGPDTAIDMNWVRQLHDALGGELAFVSSHYYAMGPASDPAMNADRLLSSAPRLTPQLAVFEGMAKSGSVSFRVTEANSCYGGGKHGVSDDFASALWAADYLLQTAAAGYAAINLHGGGDGIYTPIETVSDAVIKRPLFYGMQFANLFAGCTLNARTPSPGLTRYIGHRGETVIVALINKSGESLPAMAGAFPDTRPKSTLMLRTPQPVRLVSARSVPHMIPPRCAFVAVW